MVELFQVLGGIAGFGGVALGVLYLLYRDLVRDIIRRRMFRTLTSAQATALFGAVVVLAFVVAILGIFATLAESRGVQQFLVLVGMLLLFLLAVLFIAVRTVTGPAARPKATGRNGVERSLATVLRHIESDEPDHAERALESAGLDGDSPVRWYWKARIALARSNLDVAAGYAEEALKLDPRDPYSIALKIELLLLANDPGRRDRAVRLAEESTGLSGELDTWLRQLRAEGMFGGGVRTRTRFEARCPLPTRTTEDVHAE
ncbi:type IV pilus biogenesis/stability protein PilW [Streptomyces sp. NPDC020801]|uniref:tetratricopeptide repeat protein n=1 Tax=unclassified Streptomyces TaxID=2593676 RepID=UPI00379FC126